VAVPGHELGQLLFVVAWQHDIVPSTAWLDADGEVVQMAAGEPTYRISELQRSAGCGSGDEPELLTVQQMVPRRHAERGLPVLQCGGSLPSLDFGPGSLGDGLQWEWLGGG
jgi:hypothetical protein